MIQSKQAILLKNVFPAVIVAVLIIFAGVFTAEAQIDGGVSVSAGRIEVIIPAGGERTFGYAVDYIRDYPEAKLPLARLVARLEDWSLGTNGEIKFAPVSTLPNSAASWVTYSPSELTLDADKRQILRFTVNVPKGTAPGDYLFACYIENRNPPPLPKEGERQINVSFRYYTMIYVMVPGLTYAGELLGMETNLVNGMAVVKSSMGNKGNSHLRPKHSVEIRDEADKVIFNSPMADTTVLLGGGSWQMNYPLNAELPAGNYKLSYTVDFGNRTALQRAKTTFQVGEADIALRKKFAEEVIAAEKQNNPPVTTTAAATSMPVEKSAAVVPPTAPNKETIALADAVKAPTVPIVKTALDSSNNREKPQ